MKGTCEIQTPAGPDTWYRPVPEMGVDRRSMNIGLITCNYYMRIYGYQKPENFDWGVMVRRYEAEYGQEDFLRIAREIHAIGYRHLEIWAPTFSYNVYTAEVAGAMGRTLRELGFESLVYCIGGWGAGDLDRIETAYRFAAALGAGVITGCISAPDADRVLAEADRCGRLYGIRYAIENHPAPNLESPQEILEQMMRYETIGANLDTGIYHAQGYDLLAAARLLGERIYHVHAKDTPAGGGGCYPLGTAGTPLAPLLRLLRDRDYEGMISVEYEADGDPVPGLYQSLGYITGVLAD